MWYATMWMITSEKNRIAQDQKFGEDDAVHIIPACM